MGIQETEGVIPPPIGRFNLTELMNKASTSAEETASRQSADENAAPKDQSNEPGGKPQSDAADPEAASATKSETASPATAAESTSPSPPPSGDDVSSRERVAEFADALMNTNWTDDEQVAARKSEGFILAHSLHDVRETWNEFAPDSHKGLNAPNFIKHNVSGAEPGIVHLPSLIDRMSAFQWPTGDDGKTHLEDIEKDPVGNGILSDLSIVAMGDTEGRVVPDLWKTHGPHDLQNEKTPAMFAQKQSAMRPETASPAANPGSGERPQGSAGDHDPDQTQAHASRGQQRAPNSDVLGLGKAVSGLAGLTGKVFDKTLGGVAQGAAATGRRGVRTGAAIGATSLAAYRRKKADRDVEAAHAQVNALSSHVDRLVKHPEVAHGLSGIQSATDDPGKRVAKSALAKTLSYGAAGRLHKGTITQSEKARKATDAAIKSLEKAGRPKEAKALAKKTKISMKQALEQTKGMPPNEKGESARTALKDAAKRIADALKAMLKALLPRSRGPSPG